MSYSFHRPKEGLKAHVCESCGWVTDMPICPACAAVHNAAADCPIDSGSIVRAQHNPVDFTDPFDNRVAPQPRKGIAVPESPPGDLASLYPYSILSNRKVKSGRAAPVAGPESDLTPFAGHTGSVRLPDLTPADLYPSQPRRRIAGLPVLLLAGVVVMAAYYLIPFGHQDTPAPAAAPMQVSKNGPAEQGNVPVMIMPASEVPMAASRKLDTVQPAENPDSAQIDKDPDTARSSEKPEAAATDKQCSEVLLALALCNK